MTTQILPCPPFQHLLVPLDGSQLAEAVLPIAGWLAAACQARITLLHVLEHDAPETVHGEQHLGEADEANVYLAGVVARLAAGGTPVEAHVHPNQEHDVARAIVEHAQELHADVIALTTHGSGGLRGFLFGSIAQQVLSASVTPVLVARPEVKLAHSGPLLVALDGGREAEQALPAALMLALASGVPLQLLRVVRTTGVERGPAAAVTTFMPSASAALLDIEEQEAGAYLASLAARLPAGVTVRTTVRRGEPADEIVRVARQTACRMLLATTHGKAGLESVFAGSVIPRVLPRLAAPLLLTRLPER